MMVVNGGGSSRRKKVVSEINITPMVDVVLVLLIIFMVTAPMMIVGVDVNLPQTKASSSVDTKSSPLVISIDKNETIFLFETEIKREDLAAKLEKVTSGKKETQIFIKGDRSLSYGAIMEIMGEISNAGFTKVALLSNMK